VGYGLILTNDGSYTLYSKKYSQHYHSVEDGAINESLAKYVIPALNWSKLHNLKQINILDICFGIGYNTFATIDYIVKNNINIKVKFYSPEFDINLIKSLKLFSFPSAFKDIKHIIEELSNNYYYKDNQFEISIYLGDARKYIKTLKNIDIVYQDPFSSDVNKELWTKEYFNDIYNCTKNNCFISTYSIATPVRLSMWESKFIIYEYKSKSTNRQTIAHKYIEEKKLENIKYIDMILKQKRNPIAKSLKD
jgi:tRNA U34 5-methylaminomethyl-2-thiouridine-forming methyltransferase MnmC